MKTIHSYLLIIIFAFGLLVHAASAFTSTWNAASGNWSEALKWSPMGDPNGNNFDVIFNNGGSLTLDGARTVGTYSQTGGTFTITSGQSFILNSAGTLKGGGVMNLGNVNTKIYTQSANVVFTNSAGTIRGSGQIGYNAPNGLSVLNQANGIIQADISGELLYLNGAGTFTNKGLMRAQGGGTLVFEGSFGPTFNNNATIRSENGSNVSITFSKIVGGTLDNTGSTGTITLDDGTIRDVTIPAGSTVVTGLNRAGSIENTVVNHGTLSPSAGEVIYVGSNTTLSGGGAVVLTSINSSIQNNGSNRTLTNTDNVLHGTGQIGYNSLSVINGAAGIIQADVSGQTLLLNGSGTFTNNGLMRAQGGGTLTFEGSSAGIFNNNATIRSENGSNVSITFSKIVGGTLDNTGSTGTITLDDGTIRDVTIPAGSTVVTGLNRAGSIENTVVNHGTLSPSAGEVIYVGSNTTLSGGGAVVLTSINSHVQNNGSSRTLTNTDNTLRGTGQIGYDSLSVINGAAGIIQADASGQSLWLNGSGAFTNNGLFVARNGATLQQSSGTLTNFSGSTLTGGTWMAIDQGGGATLSLNIGPVVTNAGTIILDGANAQFLNGSNTNAVGTLASNQGSLQLLHKKLLTTSAPLSSSGDLLVGAGSSLTVAGALNVTAGTIRGAGKIFAPVNVGTQAGAGALLSPGDSGTGTLTIKGALTFKATATYNCELNFHTAKADKVVAKVVGINSGAQFSFIGLKSGALTPGTVFTVISCTSKQPIAGTFSNLANGSTFSAKGNTFQVSYQGGDGNDLTLTVMP